jgi:dihydrolipoamide dehydrogenase
MVVGEFTQDADVVVIGAGPAGHACACRAAELGRDVTLVDPRPTLGGDCLHNTCIPTKTLLHAIDAESGEAGKTFDPPAMKAWLDRVTRRLEGGLAAGAKARGVEVLRGTARFLSPRELQIAGEHISRLRFKRAVVCCGPHATPLAGCIRPSDLPDAIDRLTGQVAVLGDSAWAVESASICAALGCQTTLFAGGPTPLPHIPQSLVQALIKASAWDCGGPEPVEVRARDTGWALTQEGAAVPVDLVVDARQGQLDLSDLDLAAAGVSLDEAGCVQVDSSCTTSERRILAAGACTRATMDAGAAATQGRVAAEVIAGLPAGWEPAAVPTVVFSNPQLAWSGEVCQDAAHVEVPWAYSGLAVTMKASGLTVLHWDPSTGTVLGAGAVGPCATELADFCTLAVELGATIQDLADMAGAHPTRSELFIEAARQALHQS